MEKAANSSIGLFEIVFDLKEIFGFHEFFWLFSIYTAIAGCLLVVADCRLGGGVVWRIFAMIGEVQAAIHRPPVVNHGLLIANPNLLIGSKVQSSR